MQFVRGTSLTLQSIVAVHGLNGHREKTWTCNETSGDDVLWLRDLLPNRIPGARVWTWGYDSRTHTRSHRDYLTTKKLYDHGRELVFDLEVARRGSKSHQRPIIFIAHSLGGIVVKNVSPICPSTILSAITNDVEQLVWIDSYNNRLSCILIELKKAISKSKDPSNYQRTASFSWALRITEATG